MLGRWMAGRYMWDTARNEEYRPATTEGYSRKNQEARDHV